MKFPTGLNNSTVYEKTRHYGKIIEWEVRHQCVADIWDTIKIEDIDKTLLVCMLCRQDIVVFNKEQLEENNRIEQMKRADEVQNER